MACCFVPKVWGFCLSVCFSVGLEIEPCVDWVSGLPLSNIPTQLWFFYPVPIVSVIKDIYANYIKIVVNIYNKG